jgi:hypothetical protein
MVGDGPGGGREGEEVVHGGGHLEGALVAVAHNPGDPFRIDHARPHHPGDLFLQSAHLGALGPGMVVVVDAGPAAGKVAHRHGEPALELVVVVGIQQVVLPVVLVVDHRLDPFEPSGEEILFRPATGARPIGVAAPGQIGPGQIRVGVPAALVDQGLQAGPIGPGLGAEDPEAGPPGGLLRCDPLGH